MTFGTMTRDLIALSERLSEREVKVVAMESTGVHWRPIFNVLEGANIKLGDVATDVMGISARAMLKELAAGKTSTKAMADLAMVQLKNKKPEPGGR